MIESVELRLAALEAKFVCQNQPMTIRERIRAFNVAFNRPVNLKPTDIPVSERELLGKLLLEETLEFCVKGLGLRVYVDMTPGSHYSTPVCHVGHVEGVLLNHIECADGLGDVNVVINQCADWLGYNLDDVTTEIHESNMSKLDEDGKPIINDYCPECPDEPRHLIDPSKPVGKILKGPNFRKPNIAAVIFSEKGNS